MGRQSQPCRGAGMKQADLAKAAGLHENAVVNHERAPAIRGGYACDRIKRALAEAGAEITADGVRIVVGT